LRRQFHRVGSIRVVEGYYGHGECIASVCYFYNIDGVVARILLLLECLLDLRSTVCCMILYDSEALSRRRGAWMHRMDLMRTRKQNAEFC
jgi:hypothetical protein